MPLTTHIRKLRFRPNPVNHGYYATRENSTDFIAYGVRYRIQFRKTHFDETGERSWRVYREEASVVGDASTLTYAENLAQADFNARLATDPAQQPEKRS
jgi:hypothetical protein